MRRVAVTGIGVISPLGNSAAELFHNLIEGRSGVRRLKQPAFDRLSYRVAAPAEFNGEDLFEPPRLRMLDRVSQFALAAAKQAMEDAGLTHDRMNMERTGVFLGTGMGGANAMDDAYKLLYEEQADRLKPFSVLLAMNNAAASWIALEYGISGPNFTYTTACSSSAVAIGEAAERIRRGDVDVMFAGGAEAPLTLGTLKAWEALHTMAEEDEADPSASCKPFSANRTGMVLGEGAVILMLEELEHAITRGAPVHAELIGYGLATDNAHITRPGVEGQARALRAALTAARIDADEVGYINAHGTGTQANDATETAAIKEVFGEHAYRLAVSSTKSMHGHLLGAAGALECAITVLALKEQKAPPTMHLHMPDPECDLD
ncbi:MAG: 3-oxoacyl-[acyl-carrier-protein] synthase, partial [Paucimonas sp.]|nr:3-oxoacyl-[acyl-carrier-protein] synthase [Paucimonas sp.]